MPNYSNIRTQRAKIKSKIGLLKSHEATTANSQAKIKNNKHL